MLLVEARISEKDKNGYLQVCVLISQFIIFINLYITLYDDTKKIFTTF